jgi:hypothetical protein
MRCACPATVSVAGPAPAALLSPRRARARAGDARRAGHSLARGQSLCVATLFGATSRLCVPVWGCGLVTRQAPGVAALFDVLWCAGIRRGPGASLRRCCCHECVSIVQRHINAVIPCQAIVASSTRPPSWAVAAALGANGTVLVLCSRAVPPQRCPPASSSITAASLQGRIRQPPHWHVAPPIAAAPPWPNFKKCPALRGPMSSRSSQ